MMGKIPHTAQCSEGVQFTHQEWTNSNLDHFHNAEASRHVAERIRSEAEILISDRNSKTTLAQLDVSAKLSDRVRDIREWREELTKEREKLAEEIDHLTEARRHLDYAGQQAKRPLKVCQDCLTAREERVGIDQVKDLVEKNLKKEVANIQKYQQKIKILQEKVHRQLNELEERRDKLDSDAELKAEARLIDHKCQALHNNATDVTLHSGIERVEQAASVPASWRENSQTNIRNSLASREVSQEIRDEIDTLINEAAKDMLNHWTNTNRSLQERISEVQETKGKILSHINLVDRDVQDMDTLIQRLRDTKLAKQGPLKVAQTRLKQRSHRPDIESCNDPPHNKLLDEVDQLRDTVLLLDHKITEAEAARLDLLSNRQRLEEDMRVKKHSLRIDMEKCLTLRMTFPFNIRCSVTSKRVERRRFRLDMSED